MRTEGYQALRCPTCGEAVFVLPRSPLPEPPVPASASPTRGRVAAEVEAAYPDDEPIALTDPDPMAVGVADVAAKPGGRRAHPEAEPEPEPEAEIDWVDGVADEADARPVASAKADQAPAHPPRPARPKPAPAPKPSTAGPSTLRPQVRKSRAESWRDARAWAVSHRNGLLIAGAVLLIVGSVAFNLHRQRLEELPKVAEVGRVEGIKKLEAGEFDAAKKLLGDAAEAVDALGGRFEGADQIRDAALEAAIFADRASEGLAEIVEEAATSNAKDWPSKFSALYKGRSVILDAPISAVPDPNKPGSAFEVDYPIYYGRGPKPQGRGRIDLAGFRLFEKSRPKVGDQDPFGARLAAVELDVETNEWVVRFEPNSGVYIGHTRALDAIDWPKPLADREPAP